MLLCLFWAYDGDVVVTKNHDSFDERIEYHDSSLLLVLFGVYCETID